jgi:glyoxylase-like metal-dependent hydrolase (beta-lactamase superfamily II)
VGGLMAGAERAFPNATVRADQREGDYWLSPANLEKAPADAKDFFQGAQASMNPYVAAGKYKPFDGDTPLVPGIKALAARGHTPGHTIYLVESRGQKLVLWGDLMHVAAVQFLHPEVTIQFDTDPKAAAPQRKKAFAAAAKQGFYVGVAHVAFPGIGRLRPDGKGYRWLPANYTSGQ